MSHSDWRCRTPIRCTTVTESRCSRTWTSKELWGRGKWITPISYLTVWFEVVTTQVMILGRVEISARNTMTVSGSIIGDGKGMSAFQPGSVGRVLWFADQYFLFISVNTYGNILMFLFTEFQCDQCGVKEAPLFSRRSWFAEVTKEIPKFLYTTHRLPHRFNATWIHS